MALGIIQQPKRKYLTIHHGKVELSDNGTKSYFSFVEGKLKSVFLVQRTYGTEKVTKWIMELTDEGGEIYSLSFPYNSGTFKSIVLAMASAENPEGSMIFKIEPYQKGNFTNVVVYGNGNKLDWVVAELPPVKEVKVGSQTYKDDTDRMNFITSLVENLNKNITK